MRRTALVLGVISLSLAGSGCEEEKAPDQAADVSNEPVLEKPGPITRFRSQGAGSAPGNARRTAENVLNKAQQEQARKIGEILGD